MKTMFRNVFRLMGRRSDFFSEIVEDETTWGEVLATHIIGFDLIVAAIAIDQYPIVSLLHLICAGFLAFMCKKAG